MEGKWTYALADGWNNELFDSKEEAIAEGQRFSKEFMIGKIQEFCGTYYAENREWVISE